MLAPLAAVLLFLAAIVSAFWYLRLEEMEREQEAVKRDVEYAQQRMRLRLLERPGAADAHGARHLQQGDRRRGIRRPRRVDDQPVPRAAGVTWIDERRRISAPAMPRRSRCRHAPAAASPSERCSIRGAQRETECTFTPRATCSSRCTRSPSGDASGTALLQLHVPLADQGTFGGVILGEYSIDGLLRYGVPAEVSAKYAVVAARRQGPRAGRHPCPAQSRPAPAALGRRPTNTKCRSRRSATAWCCAAQAYRTSLGVIGSGLFWLVRRCRP